MKLHHGDCLEVMAGMEPESVDAVVTDPPYGLEFMGKEWDRLGAKSVGYAKPGSRARMSPMDTWDKRPGYYVGGSKAQEFHARWAEAAYRLAKPSAYLLAFGGTRTVHRLTSAIEDAGWIIRDMLVWAYASGFPKSKAGSGSISTAHAFGSPGAPAASAQSGPGSEGDGDEPPLVERATRGGAR